MVWVYAHAAVDETTWIPACRLFGQLLATSMFVTQLGMEQSYFRFSVMNGFIKSKNLLWKFAHISFTLLSSAGNHTQAVLLLLPSSMPRKTFSMHHDLSEVSSVWLPKRTFAFFPVTTGIRSPLKYPTAWVTESERTGATGNHKLARPTFANT